jgi:amidohydrolase
MLGHDLPEELDQFLATREDELIAFRRDLHAHPELGYHEHRTTSRVSLRLAAAGLRPVIMPKGTGLIVDIGDESAGSTLVALRADLDALPINDEKNVPYRSTVPNACPRAATTCTPRCCSAPACSWPGRPRPGPCRGASA